MRYIQYLLILLAILIIGIVVFAQEDQCDVAEAEQIIEVVRGVCDDLDKNQICYGNFEVGADLIDDYEELELPEFIFERPGDIADVENIKSIYLSALNPEEDTWGIAQMRLLMPTRTGARELNLLLFGDVEVTNSSQPTKKIEVQVGRYSTHIRSIPSVDGIVLEGIYPETIITAVGRLEDNTWLRVETGLGIVGWISADLVTPINPEDNITELEIQNSKTPYYGSMQAFVMEQGDGSGCGNLTSDGLIIQTPQGPAAVNVSINGVSIDLIPGQNGAAAVIEGAGSDTTISMVTGNGLISSGGDIYHLEPGEQLTVGSDGTPSLPTMYDPNDLNIPGLGDITVIEPHPSTLNPTAVPTDGGSLDATATSISGDAPAPTAVPNDPNNQKIDCTANENANLNACKNK